jgi:ATP phosphoribosyltransferase
MSTPSANTSQQGERSAVQTPILPSKFSEESTTRAQKSSFGAESTMSLLVDSLKDRLLLAVPKKGRLHEKCVELLSGKYPCLQATSEAHGTRGQSRPAS